MYINELLGVFIEQQLLRCFHAHDPRKSLKSRTAPPASARSSAQATPRQHVSPEQVSAESSKVSRCWRSARSRVPMRRENKETHTQAPFFVAIVNQFARKSLLLKSSLTHLSLSFLVKIRTSKFRLLDTRRIIQCFP